MNHKGFLEIKWVIIGVLIIVISWFIIDKIEQSRIPQGPKISIPIFEIGKNLDYNAYFNNTSKIVTFSFNKSDNNLSSFNITQYFYNNTFIANYYLEPTTSGNIIINLSSYKEGERFVFYIYQDNQLII